MDSESVGCGTKYTIGYTRNKSFEIVEIMLELIKAAQESGEDVMISGFGRFCVKEKAKRRGRNPATQPGNSRRALAFGF